MTASAPVRARSLLAALAVVAVAGLAPAVAQGHAAFQDASPEPGSRLARSPAEITLAFTEPLNRRLTKARLLTARGKPVAASVRIEDGNRLLLRPMRALPTGAFRVRWHTVSIRDGHALEGSFGFGVRADAQGGAQQLEQSPLARDGWLRVGLRALWYVALFFFGGGLLAAAVLRTPAGPAGWLLPAVGTPSLDRKAGREVVLRRIWGRTRVAGWIAAAAGVAVALAETQDAAGSISWRAVDAYLLATVSGGARAVAVLAVALAALLAGRAWRAAAAALVAALAAIAVGGHANSASPRALALLSDWLHLVAAVAWAGGIAQIVATWLPHIRGLPHGERREVMRSVLDRFGRLALPAAGMVVVAGATNALIELGNVSQLWETAYGRVLMVKIGFVGALITASYLHGLRLRPRLIAGAAGSPGAERRHWRLLRGEPALAALAIGAAALLAVFPLPPHQLLERAEAESGAGQATVRAAGMRPPGPDELGVAEGAGPWIAAAWVRTPAAGSVTGTVRLLDFNVRPVRAAIGIAGASVGRCGNGCATFRVPRSTALLRVTGRLHGRAHVAVIPIAWDPRGEVTAERLVRRAVGTIDRLRSFRIVERLSGGLGGRPSLSHYRISGRHDYAIVTRFARPSETIGIGRRTWTRQPDGSWQVQVDTPVDTRELMPWWPHRIALRLLDVGGRGGRRFADVALTDIPAPSARSVPFWFRLRIDLDSLHVLRMRMIAPGHFMNQRYYGFNSPVQIRPPARTR